MNNSPETIQLHGRRFRRHISSKELAETVQRLAGSIDAHYCGKLPLICPVLTGSFIFAADLSRAIHTDHEMAFVQYTSYEGMQSSGTVNKRLPFDKRCEGRHVIIVEDIVESGICMSHMLADLQEMHPASIAICTLFFKPNRFQGNFPIDYIGFSIPDDFIVGYGLDYDGAGRQYPDLYILDE